MHLLFPKNFRNNVRVPTLGTALWALKWVLDW